MSLISEEKNCFWITVVPHTFLVPLPVKHNENLKCEISEHWFVFVYFKCDFWSSHAKKLFCTKFQLDRSFRPEVIKESVNTKWQILVLIRYFSNFQIAMSQEPLRVRSWNFQSFHIWMMPTNGVKMKKFWGVRVSCPGWFGMELP